MAENSLGPLLFSAKESIYKAWYPLTQVPLVLTDCELLIDPEAGTFLGRILASGRTGSGHDIRTCPGRWSAAGRNLLTAVVLAERSSWTE